MNTRQMTCRWMMLTNVALLSGRTVTRPRTRSARVGPTARTCRPEAFDDLPVSRRLALAQRSAGVADTRVPPRPSVYGRGSADLSRHKERPRNAPCRNPARQPEDPRTRVMCPVFRRVGCMRCIYCDQRVRGQRCQWADFAAVELLAALARVLGDRHVQLRGDGRRLGRPTAQSRRCRNVRLTPSARPDFRVPGARIDPLDQNGARCPRLRRPTAESTAIAMLQSRSAARGTDAVFPASRARGPQSPDAHCRPQPVVRGA